MKIFYTDTFSISLPDNHSFPITKYSLLRKRIIDSNQFSPQDLCLPHAATDMEIIRAHDPVYLDALQKGLLESLKRANAEVVIYLAGADPYKHDRFGRLDVSKEGLAERDRMVLQYCHEAGLPVAITMAGGYAPRIADTVDIILAFQMKAKNFNRLR